MCTGRTTVGKKNYVFQKQQKDVRKLMLDQSVRMYVTQMEKCNHKNVSASNFSTIMEAFDYLLWMKRYTTFYHYSKMQSKNNPPVLDGTLGTGGELSE